MLMNVIDCQPAENNDDAKRSRDFRSAGPEENELDGSATASQGDPSSEVACVSGNVPNGKLVHASKSSVGSNSCALSKCGTSSRAHQMKVIYYQNRFIAIPVVQRHEDPCFACEAKASAEAYSRNVEEMVKDFDERAAGVETTSKPTYILLKLIELLHDEDKTSGKRKKKPDASNRSPVVNCITKFLNLFFLTTGILLFGGVLVAITYTSIVK